MSRPSDISPELWERADIMRDQFRMYADDTEFVARILMEISAPKKPAGLTKRHAAALAFIEAYRAENAYSPSYREVAEHLGCGLGYASEAIHQLQERGCITLIYGRARSIALVDA